jgi:hypothetical protein
VLDDVVSATLAQPYRRSLQLSGVLAVRTALPTHTQATSETRRLQPNTHRHRQTKPHCKQHDATPR